MKRAAYVIRLKADHRDTYVELHKSVWPPMQAALRETGHRNFSLFVHDDRVVLYFEFEGDDMEARRASLRTRPELAEWMAVTAACQEPFENRPAGSWWSPMSEIFHLA